MAEKAVELCMSANGKKVIFYPVSSHTATHFDDTPGLQKLTEELLSGMNLEGDLIAKDFNMGRIVGNTDVVEVDDTDVIVYAMRRNREDQGYVPFTKSCPAQPCSSISVSLAKKDPGTYELASVWIGEYESPPFPQMETATAESVPYWSRYAFVWGSQEIIPGTELDKCPW